MRYEGRAPLPARKSSTSGREGIPSRPPTFVHFIAARADAHLAAQVGADERVVAEQVAVDDGHCFAGFDAYKQVIASADVVLTSTGGQLLRGRVNSRKKLLKEQLKKLPIFRTVVEALQRSEDHRADEDAFLETFAIHLPSEDPESMLKTVIDWGRYAELFAYDEQSETFNR